MFILASQKKDGTEYYYTGRVGDGWVSIDIKEAFTYSEPPKDKMLNFNNCSIMHGHWFHCKELV